MLARISDRRYDKYSTAMLRLLQRRNERMASFQNGDGTGVAPNKSDSVSKVLEAMLRDDILPKNLKYEIASWVLGSLMQYPLASDEEMRKRIEREFDSIEPCDFIPFQRLEDAQLNVTNMEDEVKSVGLNAPFHV